MEAESKENQRRILASAVVAVVLMASGTRLADATEPDVRLAHGNLGYSAMRVVRDPQTGRLVVRRPDRVELAELTLPDVFAPVPVALSAGGYKVDTRARYLHFLAVATDPVDGSISTTCAAGTAEAPTCAPR